MKVATVVGKTQNCPHHNIMMEYGETTRKEPTWTCHECEIDYTVADLIKESRLNPEFVVQS